MAAMVKYLLFILSIISIGQTKYMEGELKTGDNWAFLARFCFLSLHGKFEYDIEYPEAYATENLDLYYDTVTQWPRVYGDSSNLTSCKEKESVLQVENNQFINLTTDTVYSGCQRHYVPVDNSSFFRCRGSRNFKTARERWWFVAISNCQSAKGLKLRYKFWLTNGEPWDFLHYHYSADEFYILPILMVYGFLNLLLLVMTFRSAVQLRSRQLLHTTFKLFWSSVLLQTFGVFLLSLSYLSYGMNGYGLPNGKLLGRILESASEITFLLLLILLAKGYTVTRARLRQMSTIKVTIFICAYVIMYMALFLCEKLYFDPGKVLYLYESSFGYGLVILRMVGWLIFIYATFFTLKHYPEKGGFYYPFFCFYTLWFVASPAIIVLGNNLIAKWVREKVVSSVEHCVALVGHTVFLILTRPSAHNKNFPYHVRTTQIGIMEAISSHTTVGNHTLDEFGHHGYGVSPNNARNLDVFTVNTHQAPPSAPITAQWTSEQTVPLHPPTRSSQPSSRPNSGNSDKTGESTLPPYTPPQGLSVYDPNASDELKDWDDRNN
eukprot:TRINITY_DN13400_c0_g1_i1.p1 TRINITY_DN13400_c0_g1~~TRINITY_DN13400_c0_g1_i1.p1  ORF type:complete len:549 (+),score=97.43 TRINITY_DN13400_c0_g1_i1:261-1907(+)